MLKNQKQEPVEHGDSLSTTGCMVAVMPEKVTRLGRKLGNSITE